MPSSRAKTRSLVSKWPGSCRKYCSEPLSESGVRCTFSFCLPPQKRSHTYIQACISVSGRRIRIIPWTGAGLNQYRRRCLKLKTSLRPSALLIRDVVHSDMLLYKCPLSVANTNRPDIQVEELYEYDGTNVNRVCMWWCTRWVLQGTQWDLNSIRYKILYLLIQRSGPLCECDLRMLFLITTCDNISTISVESMAGWMETLSYRSRAEH